MQSGLCRPSCAASAGPAANTLVSNKPATNFSHGRAKVSFCIALLDFVLSSYRTEWGQRQVHAPCDLLCRDRKSYFFAGPLLAEGLCSHSPTRLPANFIVIAPSFIFMFITPFHASIPW